MIHVAPGPANGPVPAPDGFNYARDVVVVMVEGEPSSRRASNEAAILAGLNEEQVKAVLAPERVALVVAAAGSGKTKVLVSRILHQIYCEGLPGEALLGLTFSRDAAQEMRQRLGRAVGIEISPTGRRTSAAGPTEAVTLSTFHSLAYRILKHDGAKVFNEKFRLLADGTLVDGLRPASESATESGRRILLQLAEDPAMLKHIVRLVEDYLNGAPRPVQRVKPPPDHRTRRYFRTYRGEWVRSKSERDIANFLFLSRIDYEYERPLTVQGTTIHPDFYLPQGDVYIEHWGDIDAAYIAARDAKRPLYRGLRLIETHEEEMTDLAALEARLRNELKPLLNTAPEVPTLPDLEARFEEYRPAVKRLTELLLEIHTKMKVENKPIDEVVRSARRDPHEIVRIFYTVAVPFCERYQRYLTDQSLIDQDDLLILANRLLESDAGVRMKYQRMYRQVLVDEYQDVNLQQVRFIQLLVGSQNRLFCVGDDWQAIYGWRGSDVRFIVDFAQQFPEHGRYILPLNYRSHRQIVELSNGLIAHNKYKIEKQPRAARESGPPVAIYRARDEREDGVSFVVERVKELAERGCRPEDMLLLYRKRSDLAPYSEALGAAGLRVTTKTMHGSKGLEANYVFVVGLKGGTYGFPNVREDARIMQLIRASDLQQKLEEERRLFYVALTRAREGLFLITAAGNPSSFIAELPPLGTTANDELPVFPTGAPGTAEVEVSAGSTPAETRGAYAALLEWRTTQARADAVPEMTVASDRLLFEIASRRPASVDALRMIDGVGPVRAEKYGHRWLEILGTDSTEPALEPPDAPPHPEQRGFLERLRRLLGPARAPPGSIAKENGPSASQRSEAAAAGTPTPPAPQRPPADPNVLKARLRSWREAEAKRRGVPSYVVLQNRTIDELIAKRPKTVEGLREVHGIGARRAQQYGGELLSMLGG